MANRERPRDRGARIGREQLARLGREARDARIRAGVTQRTVAASTGTHRSWIGLFEQGKADGIAFHLVAEILGVLGLDLKATAFPGGDAIRDEGHAALIQRFFALLADSIGRASEVPLPAHGDPRAWDVVLRSKGQVWGVEAETHIGDVQATLRRLALKRRDGGVDGMILVLTDGRYHRQLLRDHGALFRGSFPGDAKSLRERLPAGWPPLSDTMILL